MKNITLRDKDHDQLSFSTEQDSIIVVTQTHDAEYISRIGVVELSKAQARQLYMWLAGAIGMAEEGCDLKWDNVSDETLQDYQKRLLEPRRILTIVVK